jgi:hypothetical protein
MWHAEPGAGNASSRGWLGSSSGGEGEIGSLVGPTAQGHEDSQGGPWGRHVRVPGLCAVLPGLPGRVRQLGRQV